MTPGTVDREGIAFQRRLDEADFAAIPSDAPYDDIARLARHLCGSAIALVATTGRGGLSIRACSGMDARDIVDTHAFCAHISNAPTPVEIVDARTDPRFARHRLVAAEPGLRFCAGAALAGRHGDCLGSLCVLDRYPRALDATQRDGLTTLARMTAALVDAHSAPTGDFDPVLGAGGARGIWTTLPLSAAPPQRVFDDRYAVAIIELDGGSVPASMRERAMRQVQDIAAAVLGHDDVLSRDGPGELLLVFAHAAHAAAALERIGEASASLPGRPRVAIGAAIGQHDRVAMEDVFLEAESALHRARVRDGRRIVFASTPPMNA
jgi:hypothetical protein